MHAREQEDEDNLQVEGILSVLLVFEQEEVVGLLVVPFSKKKNDVKNKVYFIKKQMIS
jgi:nitrate reductase NapAB chaperone NapD